MPWLRRLGWLVVFVAANIQLVRPSVAVAIIALTAAIGLGYECAPLLGGEEHG